MEKVLEKAIDIACRCAEGDPDWTYIVEPVVLSTRVYYKIAVYDEEQHKVGYLGEI